MAPIIYVNNNKDKAILAFGEETSIKMGAGNALQLMDAFLQLNAKKYIFGYLSYDLKNEIEALSSRQEEKIGFPDVFLFCPKYVVELSGNNPHYLQGTADAKSEAFIASFLGKQEVHSAQSIQLQPSQSKAVYIDTVEQLKDHLQRGDIYEITYCQEFFAEQVKIDPLATYFQLNERTCAPFSCYVAVDDNYLMSGSPERFLQRTGRKLISQPIKGTARRDKNTVSDEQVKQTLLTSEKERAENVMIVDLVRNDLSRIAEPHSVQVDELIGLYTFPTVHQLISTVSATHRENLSFSEIIRALFPMGSMTGAPKISAMQLIERYETFKRGLFSGAVGYISPNGDFDFNVVIRSILYNAKNGYLSCPVGSAITIKSDPAEEYEECLLKAAAMKDVLAGTVYG